MTEDVNGSALQERPPREDFGDTLAACGRDCGDGHAGPRVVQIEAVALAPLHATRSCLLLRHAVAQPKTARTPEQSR